MVASSNIFKNISFFTLIHLISSQIYLMINKLKKRNKIFIKWFNFCLKNNIEPYKACYLFVKKNKYVKKIILGADSSFQINQIINCKKKFIKTPNFKVKDEFLLNPYKWSGGLREEI